MSEQLSVVAPNIEVMLVRMEAKMDRMNDKFERYERDNANIRERIHDLSNTIQPLVAMDLPARVRTSDTHRAEVDTRLKALEDIEMQRKGAAALAKVIWAIGGALGISGIAGLVAVFKGVL